MCNMESCYCSRRLQLLIQVQIFLEWKFAVIRQLVTSAKRAQSCEIIFNKYHINDKILFGFIWLGLVVFVVLLHYVSFGQYQLQRCQKLGPLCSISLPFYIFQCCFMHTFVYSRVISTLCSQITSLFSHVIPCNLINTQKVEKWLLQKMYLIFIDLKH